MDNMSTIIKLFADMCVEKGITLDEISQYFPNNHYNDDCKTNSYDCDISFSRVHQTTLQGLATVEFELNDVIGFTLSDGEYVEAVVVDINPDNHRVTFVFKNCFRDECTYTDIDNFLISKYLMFPKSLKNVIDDDSFKLLSKEDVFGGCRYEYFNHMKNRMCNIDNGVVIWWLDNFHR